MRLATCRWGEDGHEEGAAPTAGIIVRGAPSVAESEARRLRRAAWKTRGCSADFAGASPGSERLICSGPAAALSSMAAECSRSPGIDAVALDMVGPTGATRLMFRGGSSCPAHSTPRRPGLNVYALAHRAMPFARWSDEDAAEAARSLLSFFSRGTLLMATPGSCAGRLADDAMVAVCAFGFAAMDGLAPDSAPRGLGPAARAIPAFVEARRGDGSLVDAWEAVTAEAALAWAMRV